MKQMSANPLIDHSLDHSKGSVDMVELTAEIKAQIDDHLAKYPDNQRQSAVMPALMLVQRYNGGSLNKTLIQAVSDYLGIESISAEEVATFYSLYQQQPQGKYVIAFCHNLSCMLCGGENLIEYIEKKLSIKVGQTTPDCKFTLRKVECLGACCGAPMMQIGDQYYEHLTEGKIDQILDQLG